MIDLVTAGQNRQHSTNKNTAALDRETDELHHTTVSLDVSKLIQKSRQAKEMTQKDLATVYTFSNTCEHFITEVHLFSLRIFLLLYFHRKSTKNHKLLTNMKMDVLYQITKSSLNWKKLLVC